MIDQERLEAIRDRLNAATKGRWCTDWDAKDEKILNGYRSCGASVWADPGGVAAPVPVIVGGSDYEQGETAVGVCTNLDAEFIINAKADIEWLLEHLGEAVSE